MRFALVMCAALAGGPAGAAGVEISGCVRDIDVTAGIAMDCDVTNGAVVAVASMKYRVVAAQTDRTVPWLNQQLRIVVPGGIEPQETRRLTFVSGPFGMPDEADASKVIFIVTPVEAYDVNGALIE